VDSDCVCELASVVVFSSYWLREERKRLGADFRGGGDAFVEEGVCVGGFEALF
jgi:hypothetical protein